MQRRLISLDAFRGLTVAAMILVNNPAGEADRYQWLRHAEWNGCLPADLIFPAFLFIAGVSVTLSVGARRARGDTHRSIVAKVVRRSAIIFLLGVVLNALPYFDWEIVRASGVLQRLAFAYLFGSLIALRWRWSGQAGAAAVLLVGYWALLTFVPVPGQEPGVLLPEANLGAWLDRLVLGGHLLHPGWDPEGILGSVSAITSVLAGTLAGEWIERCTRRDDEKSRERVVEGLLLGGVAAAVLGLCLDRWVPLNKNLWSSSYVLFSSGASAGGLALCFWLVEVQRFVSWTRPFVVFGTNPIVAYGASSFFAKMLELFEVARPDGAHVLVETYLVDSLQLLVASRPLASLLYAVLYTGLWLVLLTPLYRRRWLVRI